MRGGYLKGDDARVDSTHLCYLKQEGCATKPLRSVGWGLDELYLIQLRTRRGAVEVLRMLTTQPKVTVGQRGKDGRRNNLPHLVRKVNLGGNVGWVGNPGRQQVGK